MPLTRGKYHLGGEQLGSSHYDPDSMSMDSLVLEPTYLPMRVMLVGMERESLAKSIYI